MTKASNFELKEEEESFFFDLAQFNKVLHQKSDDFEKLEYLESELTKYRKGVSFCEHEIKKIKNLHKYRKVFNPAALVLQRAESNSANQTPKIASVKPTFKPEAIPVIFEILKTHFTEDERNSLLSVLITGDTPKAKLLFMNNGKTLLDFFKQLMKGQFLSIAVQKEMENWIAESFEFLKDGKRTSITPKYASKIISANDGAAEGNRLIDVINKDGKFKIVQLELNSREQN
jgi:hypothetical protein